MFVCVYAPVAGQKNKKPARLALGFCPHQKSIFLFLKINLFARAGLLSLFSKIRDGTKSNLFLPLPTQLLKP
jgi:hypothetical protein